MPLTDTAIHSAKPADKTRKLFDGRGLYLEVAPAGGGMSSPARETPKATAQ